MSNQQPVKQAIDVQKPSIGRAFDEIEGLLKTFNFSHKEEKELLLLIGAKRGLKIQSSFIPPPAVTAGPKTQKKLDILNKPPVVKNVKVRSIRDEIKHQNDLIKEESSKVGSKLPSDHDLIKHRDQLFRSLKNEQSGSSSSAH